MKTNLLALQAKSVILIVIVLILIGVFLTTFLSFRNDLNKAYSKLNSIPSEVYRSKYGDIEYLLVGDGPTVLVSHGVTMGADQGIWLADLALGKGYRFLYVSRFGYLKSSLPEDASARLQAAAYKDLLDYLGIDSVFILGNSAGGPSAMYFAVDYPEKCKGLILLSSHVPGAKISSAPKVVFESDFVYWLTTKLAGRSLVKMFVPPSIMETMTKEEIEKVVNDAFVAAQPISKRSKGIIFDNEVSSPSVDTIPFEQIKLPTLIIHAVDDPAPPIEGARELSERVANSELVTFDGGHLILRHEDEIKQVIRNFIVLDGISSR